MRVCVALGVAALCVLSLAVAEDHGDVQQLEDGKAPLPKASELAFMPMAKVKDAIMEKMRRMYALKSEEGAKMAKLQKMLSDEKDAAQQQAISIGATPTLNRMMKAARVDIVKHYKDSDIQAHKPLESDSRGGEEEE